MPQDTSSKLPTRDGSATEPAGNQPGGPEGPGLEYENGSRGAKSGMNLTQTRAIGAHETPVKAEDAGQLPDSAGVDKTPKPKAGTPR